MKKLIKNIIGQIEQLNTDNLIQLNNIYCQGVNYPNDEIYSNDEEFFNTFFAGQVMEAIRAVSYGEFNYTDDYVKFNGYGNLVTLNYFEVSDLPGSIQEIAEYISENPRDFYMIEL